jgi:hypothetical protein
VSEPPSKMSWMGTCPIPREAPTTRSHSAKAFPLGKDWSTLAW